jgi:hypothetical protein
VRGSSSDFERDLELGAKTVQFIYPSVEKWLLEGACANPWQSAGFQTGLERVGGLVDSLYKGADHGRR